jgi:hypothetical protein
MANQFTPWSDAEIFQLRELAGHFSSTHISTQIGRSVDGVRKQIKKLGLPNFVSTPPKPKPRPFAYGKAVETSVKVKTYVEPRKVLRQPLEAKNRRQPASYPELEWCQKCHAPVSNWSEHEARLGWFGCKRPAA